MGSERGELSGRNGGVAVEAGDDPSQELQPVALGHGGLRGKGLTVDSSGCHARGCVRIGGDGHGESGKLATDGRNPNRIILNGCKNSVPELGDVHADGVAATVRKSNRAYSPSSKTRKASAAATA